MDNLINTTSLPRYGYSITSSHKSFEAMINYQKRRAGTRKPSIDCTGLASLSLTLSPRDLEQRLSEKAGADLEDANSRQSNKSTYGAQGSGRSERIHGRGHGFRLNVQIACTA